MEKVCFKCGRLLPLEQFYKHPAMKDGHLNKCIDCAIKDVTEHRDKNLERIQKYDRERSKRPERKQLALVYQRKRRSKYPEKNLARQWAERALKNGTLKIKPCEVCGATERIEMHHKDYKCPLDVVFLCQKCHKQLHKEQNKHDVR